MKENLSIMHLSRSDLKGREVSAGRRAALASSSYVRTQQWRRRRPTLSVVASKEFHKLPNLNATWQVLSKQICGIDLASNLFGLVWHLCKLSLAPRECAFRAPTRYAVNTVVTSKYTFLNFWPLFLWEQFSRIANSYFLFVSLVEENFFFPVATSPFNFSLTNGKSTNLPILMMVLFVEALTQISEDYKKHKADAMANAKPTRRYVGGADGEM